jgi:acyl-coenzyme A synthetase/AMP-(fatty) acid ligase
MFPKGYHSFAEGPEAAKPFNVIQVFDFSSIMALSAMMLCPLAFGDALVFTFFGFMHPKFVRAVDYYNISVLSLTGFMVDKWLDDESLDGLDFSSLKVVGLSGGYVPPEKMERYREFFRSHGYQYDITAGYGMSEAGGKPIFAPKGSDRDILGFEDDNDTVRIKDENDGKFYRIEDGPRTGIRYKLSETRSKNELDGTVLFEYTEIDGKPFLCTNDLVRVNEDGSLSFAGRADKYFVNNEGKKFDSGVVDLHMAAHPAVDKCAVVPVMEKRIHDTVPVLYVVPAEKGRGAAEAIRGAFIDVYVREKKIAADNLPTQFMLVEDIPINANGKLDIFRITRERLGGDAYDLIPVFTDGALTDIQTKHVEKLNSMTAGTLPEGMENNSAYNSFDFFNTAPSGGKSAAAFPDIFGLLRRSKGEKKGFQMPEVPENVRKTVLKYGNRLSGIPNGRKSIDYDFED